MVVFTQDILWNSKIPYHYHSPNSPQITNVSFEIIPCLQVECVIYPRKVLKLNFLIQLQVLNLYNEKRNTDLSYQGVAYHV